MNRPASKLTVDQNLTSSESFQPRPTCFRCFRPEPACYCQSIQPIANRTDVTIIQHVAERDHPFNSARMVKLALDRCELFCGNVPRLRNCDFHLRSDAAILYPSKDAIALDMLDPSKLPEQLVLIDGTWAQAKSLVKSLPQLSNLQRVSLQPSQPGEFQIRREPDDLSLSTVEAAVMALKTIEPETTGLDSLLTTFREMNSQQLNHPSSRGHYCGPPKSGVTLNIPADLLAEANRIVVCYAEAGYRSSFGNKNTSVRPPVVWFAHRLGSPTSGFNQRHSFARFIEPDVELTDTFLDHLQLTEQHFESAVTLSEFRDDWSQFLNEDDVLVAYHPSTLKLLANVKGKLPSTGNEGIALNSVRYHDDRTMNINSFLVSEGVQPTSALPNWFIQHGGRAGRRLANTTALLKVLRRKKNTAEGKMN